MLESRAADARPFSIFHFDPQQASAEEWAQALAFWRLRSEEDHPGEPQPDDAHTAQNVRQHTPLHVVHRVFVRDAQGLVVGSISMGVRREGTPDYEAFEPFINVWGGVPQSHRRQGVGSLLLRELLALMDAQGKTTATFNVHLPESHAFLATIGATEKHRSMENRMAFAGLDEEALARWRADALAPAHGLRLEIHAGRVPFERLATLMAPLSALLEDAPTTGLSRPPMRYELEDFRAWYAEIDRRGGEHFLVLLLDGDEVAAVCDASWNRLYPDRMFQRLTAVARRWRGKGLAKGVKAVMLQLVRERHPEVVMAVTQNAEVNAPMLAINRRLGFAPHRHDAAYQIGTESLRAFLSTRSPASREARA
ncbi:GNAT family N-acetyltransferase [Variovorax sp. ZS18.2.2]|uniref:GNAT family N-acetyltransferase n=1 Tax=Variovorax sp. ZS18.2.2 TaxID=2971255 RepID=UPI002151C9B8|nr:GNAT family N-acetyltransferase [Variovorax sp. ZS18.2.2]MCR6480465.1 GNAT family N-acetyltransferase [Variovorax sp. ZS18.2.2]